ncbi:hypothetical protein N7501_010766 [Penicillium viridicatum]|nr:hypothetical protein N7501_010766 [Penicillium viridicatum]
MEPLPSDYAHLDSAASQLAHILREADDILWNTLSTLAEGLEEMIQIIKSEMIVGLLRSHGFTSRLNNMPESEPIRDDERGAYRMLGLDGLLVDTKIVEYLSAAHLLINI